MRAGPVTSRELLALAAPAAASAVLNNAFRIIDQRAADHLGTSAQAAMGSCVFVLIAAFALHSLVAAGAGPLIARATGAGRLEERRRIVARALSAAAAVGVGIALLALAATPAIVRLIGLEGATAARACVFLRVLLVGGLPAALGPTVDAAFIAMGRTRTMLALQALAAVLNAAGNVLALRAGFDVGGTAAATVLARTAASGLGVYLLAGLTGLRRQDLLPEPPAAYAAMLRIGAPVATNTLAYAAVYWALLHAAISPLGDAVNAALGVGFSALEGISYPIFLGLSQAVSSIVGRRLGAGEPAEAARGARLALPWMLGAGVAAGLVFHLGARTLCGAFTHDPAVLAEAEVYARTLAWSQPLVALEALAEGVLAGAGVTMPIFLWSVPLNLARVPLGVWLGGAFGARGIWWAINLSTLAKAAGKGATALRGGWSRARVGDSARDAAGDGDAAGRVPQPRNGRGFRDHAGGGSGPS